MMDLGFHEYANLFPLIEGPEFFELAEDVRVNGLAQRIDLLDRDILDGRNRYRSLVWLISTGELLGSGWGTRAGIALTADYLESDSPVFRHFNLALDGDPLAYVLSKNLKRRHLTDDDRRMVAARLVTMRQGRVAQPQSGDGQTSQIANISREAAASMLNTDVAGVDRARSVIARGTEDVVAAVQEGHISVAAAAEIAGLPVERQADILANLPRDADGKLSPDVKKALGPIIAEVRAEKVQAKRDKRVAREQAQGRQLQMLPAKTFGLAIEDFEWDHEAWSSDTGHDRHPSMHYETASDAHTPEEIVARCAERFACLADDCILFKWSTIPHLAIALKTLELQGFRYVTHLVWDKERNGAARGPGYWFTGEHEIVLVGVRGKVVPPYPAHFRSLFSAPVGAHSEKPWNLHEIAEYHWPNVPKVEFNSRSAREGWTSHGFGAGATPEGVGDIATDAAPSPSSAREPDDVPTSEAVSEVVDYAARDRAFHGADDDAMRDEYRALSYIDEGEGVGADGFYFAELRSEKLITGKIPKLTKAGKTRLKVLDEHFDALMKLNALPTDIEQLIVNYGHHLAQLHARVLAADEEGAALEIETLELLQQRANGNTNFGMACDDSLAERLRAENAAAPGVEPTWGQRGTFRLVIDGTPYLVAHDEDAGLDTYAEDPGKPFISETGFMSMVCVDCYSFGHTVAEQAEAFIREHIAIESGNGSKPKPRKRPMPIPEVVYRMPSGAEEGWEPIHVAGSIWTPEQQAAMAAHDDNDDIDGDLEAHPIGDPLSYCRVTPPGQPTVADIVRPGDIATTNYGSGPYRVIEVSLSGKPGPDWAEDCPPAYSLAMINANKKGKKPNSWINNLVAVDGRLLQLFDDNSDEVFIHRNGVAIAPPPAAASSPEIVDGVLQCRLPLSDDEMDRQLALTALAAGKPIEGPIVRDLVGIGFVHVTTDRLEMTDEGRAWLASLVGVSPVIDLPQFLDAQGGGGLNEVLPDFANCGDRPRNRTATQGLSAPGRQARTARKPRHSADRPDAQRAGDAALAAGK